MRKGIIQKRKNPLRFFCLIFACVALTGCASAAGENVPAKQKDQESVTVGSFTDNKNGTVSFSYNNVNKERYKVVTQKEGGKKYQYDIPSGQCDLVFPLSQGNGSYSLYLCKNITGNKYSIVESMNVTVDVDDELSVFLVSNYIIDWNTENEAIKKAYELTTGMTSQEEKIKAIYEYMVQNFSYDYNKMETINDGSSKEAYVPDVDETYNTKLGICYDLSSLAAAMLRSVDVPAKVVTGYSANTISYHAWNKIYFLSKKDWQTVDLTYDVQMFKDGKNYYMIKRDEYYSNIMYEY